MIFPGANTMIISSEPTIFPGHDGRKSLMYELVQVTEKCYYIQCPAKIGLVSHTVRSYLAWLKDSDQLTAQFESNKLLWQRI